MADDRPDDQLFQIRTKPTKIRIINPKTGKDLQIPSPTKAAVPAASSDHVASPASGSTLPKREAKPLHARAKRSAPSSAELKVSLPDLRLPSSAGHGKSVSLINEHDSTSGISKDTVQQTSLKEERASMPKGRSQKHSKDLPKESVGGESLRKPDVYAHAYVPEAFLAINASPAILLSSTPVQAIDFKLYTSTFASPMLLPPLASPQAPAFDGASPVCSLENLGIDNYDSHLSDCLVLDLEAQVPETRTYDMFGVQLGVVDRTQEIYSLKVSGLRENTPRVAFGDNIMVRQLIMDPATKLPHAAPATGSTGFQISAVVVAIDRPKEILNLRINGCIPHLLICNISFIVQTRWIKSLQRAVTSMASQLTISRKHESTSISENQTPEDSASSPEHDFGPIGTPIKSPPIRPRQEYFGSTTAPMKSPSVPRGDFFGAIGTPVRTPQYDRQDYFGSKASPSHGLPEYLRHPGTNGNRRSTHKSSHSSVLDIPVKYTNQAWLRRMLFPNDSDGVIQRSLPQGIFRRSWFDRHLNHEQKRAVDAILTKAYGNIPFVINGPPGTGKTKTIVETVTQMACDPSFEGTILLCAPSDSAADTLALRLRNHFEPKVMFRLNDFSRTFAEVPQELLPYCYVEDDIFNLPPLPELMACKVVVATCCTTDVLVQARVTNKDLITLENTMSDILNPQLAIKRQAARKNRLHWTALLVDEAAQATEPEILIPLSVVAPPPVCSSEPNPVFVMAGDQYQLGPRIYDGSTTLGTSLFERLSDRSIYASHPLARRNYLRTNPHAQMVRPPFVNLMRNYRSHPSILAIPSALFYANTLIPEANDTDQLESWSGWCGRGWPVLFSCNGGVDDCEDIRIVGGGWHNIREARKAISYAKGLLESQYIQEQPDICIMSPFRAQVNILRQMARKAGLWGLNVGPMDAFQGLESRFVILCTTRVRKRFLEEDAAKGAGIINEPKKFNVAITRAKQGLVVLGNPWVLEQDPRWSAFMTFCWRNGLWQTDTAGLDDRMIEANEKPVDDWEPKDQDATTIAGLERALIYRERQVAEHGSKAVRRFMNETSEDEVWRLGRLAEEALQEYDE
ncbi:MAG: hypothetical protein Q9216_005494 [Gyalolechia sp. 2 TL-2023]